MGSIRERTPGRWELRVYAGSEAGRRIYITRTFHGTEREAKKRLARLQTEVEDRAAPRPSQGTVGELLEDWWLTKDWMSAGSKRQARDDLDRYLIPHLGPILAIRLDHEPIDRLYRGLLDGRLSKSGRPLDRGTVRRLHGTLHAALAWAVKKGRLGQNPAARANAPGSPPTKVRAPEATEIRALLIAASLPQMRQGRVARYNDDFATFLRLAAATGRRRGDLLGLRIADVHFDESSVTFARRVVLVRGGITVEELDKNGRAARIGVDATTLAALKSHITAMRERALAAGTRIGRYGWLFSDTADMSEPWRPDATSRRFRWAARRADLDGFTLHGLRHAHITELLVAGVDVETVAHRVGDDPRTIYKTYSHFRPAADRRAAETWGALFEAAGVPRLADGVVI